MKIEGYFCGLDEIDFGFHMNYGEDEQGACHIITIGLFVFAIDIIRYI